jgi:NADH dehydrogenase FAD-containing subunit
MQTTADLPVFAAGSVAEIDNETLARVPPESQARTLWENLRQRFRGGNLHELRPVSPAVKFLTCSDGSAIGEYRGWALRNNWLERRRLSQDLDFLNRMQK